MAGLDDDGWEPGEELDNPGGRAAPDAAAPEAEAGPEVRPVYGSLQEWLLEHLAKIYQRRLGGALTWCPEWYRHAEAVSRLNVLWQEWEKAVKEHSLSNWWLYHCDPHMNVLMSRDNGPFMACKPDEHRPKGAGALPFGEVDETLLAGTAFTDRDQPDTP